MRYENEKTHGSQLRLPLYRNIWHLHTYQNPRSIMVLFYGAKDKKNKHLIRPLSQLDNFKQSLLVHNIEGEPVLALE